MKEVPRDKNPKINIKFIILLVLISFLLNNYWKRRIMSFYYKSLLK